MRFNQNHATSAAIAQIVASAAVWMTFRTRCFTIKSDLFIPFRAFRSVRTRKTTKVSHSAHITRRRKMWLTWYQAFCCGLWCIPDNRCSISIRLGTLDNVNRGPSVQHERTTHWFVQAVATTVTIPNTKARIEKNKGVRLWTRLFVRPWILEVGNGYRVSLNKRPVNWPSYKKYVRKYNDK